MHTSPDASMQGQLCYGEREMHWQTHLRDNKASSAKIYLLCATLGDLPMLMAIVGPPAHRRSRPSRRCPAAAGKLPRPSRWSCCACAAGAQHPRRRSAPRRIAPTCCGRGGMGRRRLGRSRVGAAQATCKAALSARCRQRRQQHMLLCSFRSLLPAESAWRPSHMV